MLMYHLNYNMYLLYFLNKKFNYFSKLAFNSLTIKSKLSFLTTLTEIKDIPFSKLKLDKSPKCQHKSLFNPTLIPTLKPNSLYVILLPNFIFPTNTLSISKCFSFKFQSLNFTPYLNYSYLHSKKRQLM